MDFSYVAARKLHHGRIPLVGLDRDRQARNACCFSFGERIREVSDFVSRHLSSIWIRQMTIRDEHGHLSEFRLQPDSAISITRTSNFNAGRMRII